MKTITSLALGAIILASAGTAAAGPLDFLFGKPRQEDRHDHGRDRDRDRHDGRFDDRRDDRHRPMRIEARAQARLRELGYYRGPVDGEFGRNSRYSLTRFQRDRGLRQTGSLDERTIRALRL